jgi:hypothetical protein
VPSFGDERMGQREQHDGVGIGTDRNPLRRGCFRTVFTNRTDVDDLDARAGEFHHPASGGMRAAAALRHLQVLGISEQHEELCVTGDRRPRREWACDRLRRAQHMRQKGERRPKTVVGRLVHEAAEGGQKAANLTSRLVKDAG